MGRRFICTQCKSDLHWVQIFPYPAQPEGHTAPPPPQKHRMHILADIGNTRTKLHLFADGKEVETACAPADGGAVVAGWAAAYPVDACALSVVGKADAGIERALRNTGRPMLRVTGTTPVPLRNEYATPATLGPDRLAAVVGAATLQPGRNLLVIDIGTCIKFDLVTADGRFPGGNISPGMDMRFRALHQFTARLPLVGKEGPMPDFGDTTETAIRAGVVQGMRLEIEGYIRSMQRKYPDLLIFLTGGNLLDFRKPSKSRIFADCNLVACGLNRILEYNLLRGTAF